MDRLLRKSAKFKMSNFVENNCRLCRDVFCCKKCREKHEIKEHNIRPDCDLCVYGKLYTINNQNDFLDHLKERHWPLHCVFCKKLFDNMDELIIHRKCSAGIKENPKKICSITKQTKDESPPVSKDFPKNILQYATSTPMQRDNEPNLFFKEMRIVITPVDYPQGSSIEKKTDSGTSKNSPFAQKRRVTWGETTQSDKSFYLRSKTSDSNQNDSPQERRKKEVTCSSEDFASAKEELSKKDNTKESKKYSNTKIVEFNDIKVKPDNLNDTDNTLWISALEESEDSVSEMIPESEVIHESEVIPEIEVIPKTPMSNTEDDKEPIIVAKLTSQKHPIMGYPTPVLTRQDYKINFQICKKIFSTPIATRKDNLDEQPEPIVHEEKTEGKIFLRKEEIRMTNNNNSEIESANDSNVGTNLWTSMTNIVKNVIQGFGNSSLSNSSGKRTYSENETFFDDSPPAQAKRYKLTDIKCRRPIRDLPAIEYRVPYLALPAPKKVFVDKATQTDF